VEVGGISQPPSSLLRHPGDLPGERRSVVVRSTVRVRRAASNTLLELLVLELHVDDGGQHVGIRARRDHSPRVQSYDGGSPLGQLDPELNERLHVAAFVELILDPLKPAVVPAELLLPLLVKQARKVHPELLDTATSFKTHRPVTRLGMADGCTQLTDDVQDSR
jgi:hypothetical protein